jgi:RimJ/RimL family protein N-acetyltransferase
MNALLMRWHNLLYHARHFRFREIGQKLAHRVHSSTCSYCLRRDLDLPFSAPDARIPLAVRKLTAEDCPAIFGDRPGRAVRDQEELYARLNHWDADIPTCYVAVTDQGAPAYIQWLMGPGQNEKIQAFFNGTFPVLAPDEALLENALTLPEFRGKGIMPAAMARIAEEGKALGVRYVLTFVEENNIPSLKGCKKSGFVPYMIRRERYLLFIRSLTFTKLPEGTPYAFDAEGAGQENAAERKGELHRSSSAL